jgi:hypothetical protein
MTMGVEPRLIGPYKSEYEMQQGLIRLLIMDPDLRDENGRDTVTEIRLIGDKLHCYAFAGGYMENIREVAQAKLEGYHPILNPSFPLIEKP